ncbi:hypothetical protein CHLRE_01g046600v5 [Chlamydomonas reinhardtii]|uniref:Uncharacterized protein n=1 Tax=Chlamydomonas reinhardtii TaxID=3055 RepID=A0A2K3E7Q8_CHLRE|nr:uncharacterized protein CHLRE_01g046600v5 [Chlamydomonas reinhardtii]PNW88803.1 hypothetical protein CHLRE_01g046600v5 [Chlamydomonas reinhardtii]
MPQAATLPSLAGKARKPATIKNADVGLGPRKAGEASYSPDAATLPGIRTSGMPTFHAESTPTLWAPSCPAAFGPLHPADGACFSPSPPASSTPTGDTSKARHSGNAPLWRRFVFMKPGHTTSSHALNGSGPQPQSCRAAVPRAKRSLPASVAGGGSGGGSSGVEGCRRLAELRAVVAGEMGPDFPAAHWPPNAAQAGALLGCGLSAAGLRGRLRQLQQDMGAPVLSYLVYAAPGLLASDEVRQLLEAAAAMTAVAADAAAPNSSRRCGAAEGIGASGGGGSSCGGGSSSSSSSSSSGRSMEVAAVDVFRAAPALMGLRAEALWGRGLALMAELAADGRDEAYFRAMLRAQPHLLAAPAEELRARLQLLREVASAPGSAGLATAAAPGGDSMRRSSGAAAGGGGGGGGHGGWLPAWGSELALATPAKLGALLHTSRRRLLRLRYVRQQLEAVSAAAAAAASKSSSGGSSSSSSSGLEPWQQQRLQQERQRQEQQMLGRWRPAEPMMAVVRYRGAEWARRHPGYADWEANYLRQEREHAEAITEWTLAYP